MYLHCIVGLLKWQNLLLNLWIFLHDKLTHLNLELAGDSIGKKVRQALADIAKVLCMISIPIMVLRQHLIMMHTDLTISLLNTMQLKGHSGLEMGLNFLKSNARNL